jgi:hypothetical protein
MRALYSRLRRQEQACTLTETMFRLRAANWTYQSQAYEYCSASFGRSSIDRRDLQHRCDEGQDVEQAVTSLLANSYSSLPRIWVSNSSQLGTAKGVKGFLGAQSISLVTKQLDDITNYNHQLSQSCTMKLAFSHSPDEQSSIRILVAVVSTLSIQRFRYQHAGTRWATGGNFALAYYFEATTCPCLCTVPAAQGKMRSQIPLFELHEERSPVCTCDRGTAQASAPILAPRAAGSTTKIRNSTS